MARMSDLERFEWQTTISEARAKTPVAKNWGIDGRRKNVKAAVKNMGHNLPTPITLEEAVRLHSARTKRLIRALIVNGYPRRFYDESFWLFLKKGKKLVVTKRAGKQFTEEKIIVRKVRDKKGTRHVGKIKLKVVDEWYDESPEELTGQNVYYVTKIAVFYKDDYYYVGDDECSDTWGEEGQLFAMFHYKELNDLMHFLNTEFVAPFDKGKLVNFNTY